MSADNWAVCPSCLAKAERVKEAEKKAVLDGYGKVTIEEFDALRAIADTPINTHAITTFREDWEIGLIGAIVFTRYRGGCGVCNSGIQFEDETPIQLKEPK